MREDDVFRLLKPTSVCSVNPVTLGHPSKGLTAVWACCEPFVTLTSCPDPDWHGPRRDQVERRNAHFSCVLGLRKGWRGCKKRAVAVDNGGSGATTSHAAPGSQLLQACQPRGTSRAVTLHFLPVSSLSLSRDYPVTFHSLRFELLFPSIRLTRWMLSLGQQLQ